MEDFLSDLHDEIDAALAGITARYGEEVATSIRPILLANVRNGRFKTFSEGQNLPLLKYVERLTDGYQKHHRFIKKLQVEKEDLAWGPLYSQISAWIFNLFLRKGFAPEYCRAEIVPELAQEASIQILNAQFTYDVDFDPWAYTIVRDTCFKYMRSAMKKSAVPAHALVDLDEAVENKVEDSRHRPDDLGKENRVALLAAIDKLSPERREVIMQKYFYEYSSEKIAENTHKTVAAVYSMHFNAIENLRKILSD